MVFWIQRICDHLKLLAQFLSVFGIRSLPPYDAFDIAYLIVLSILYFLEAHQDLATDMSAQCPDLEGLRFQRYAYNATTAVPEVLSMNCSLQIPFHSPRK